MFGFLVGGSDHVDTSHHIPSRDSRKGRKFFVFASGGLVCLLVGILIATNLDFSPQAVAEPPLNVLQTGAYPVVQRNGDMESPFVSVVEKIQNAVVNISARSASRRLPWWVEGPRYSTSSGSGFFFRDDGYILTNNHVIQNAQKVDVRTASGYEYEADVVGTDPETDLAVLKVKPEENITVIPFGDSDKLKVGDWAIAIGNPFPQQGLDRTVTVGVVSAVGRGNLYFGEETPRYQYYIQTDASINPGNSGGPLLNLHGECIGVNAAISTPTGGSVGIGFAIPINLARAVVPDLIEHGKPRRGWLGIYLSPVTERDAKRQGLTSVRGVKIDSVFHNSPADRAGLKSGDIIVAFNGMVVESPSQLSVLVSTVTDGSTVPIDVYREGNRSSVNTMITDRDSFLASLNESPVPSQPEQHEDEIMNWLGLELTPLTKDLADALGIEHVKGIYVQGVYPDTPADRASIAKGTIILQINKMNVDSLDDIAAASERTDESERRFALIVQEPDGTIARKVIRP